MASQASAGPGPAKRVQRETPLGAASAKRRSPADSNPAAPAGTAPAGMPHLERPVYAPELDYLSINTKFEVDWSGDVKEMLNIFET